jgi:CheY-like chemotaxis protein
MLKLLRRLIGEDIELAWHPGARLWPVTMDPSQVDQILANLCVNARDALAGVGSLTLETENISMDAAYCAGHLDALPGDFVQLTVSDNGCGMDSATLAQIFEPFFSTKGVGQGTGLGLATVYGIVKQNNGFIHASSELGRGTCFHVYLPRTMNVAAPTVAHPAVEAPRGHGETILLVEDEPSLRTLGTHSMTSLGYVVLVAESPEVALRMAATHKGKISLLLTDVVMPGMNGQQLAERILADQPAIKVLFMSGYPADVIAQRGVLERDMSFLPKPFLRADLACKLREMLDGSPGAARLPA